MTPTSSKPLNKISAATLAGLLTAAVFWALRRYANVDLDAEGLSVITALVAGLAGYFTPIAPGEITRTDLLPAERALQEVLRERAEHDAETKPIETRPL